MSHEDDEKEIEASKAPLMDHLIELRSRLIKALLAFGVAFIFCFFFAKQIYNVLVWPFVWVAGPENSKFIYTGLLEYFIVQLKLAMFGAAFISFPVVATQIYMFVAPGLYRNERQAFLPYLVATPIFFFARLDGGLFPGLADAGALFARHAASRRRGPGDDRAAAQGRRISVADDVADLRLRRRLPAAGDPDAARPRRHHHVGAAQGRSGATSSSAPSSSPPCSRRPTCSARCRSRCRCCCSTRARSGRCAWWRRRRRPPRPRPRRARRSRRSDIPNRRLPT